MPSNSPSPRRPRKISRRQFARDAALAGATAALLPASLLAQERPPEKLPPAVAADYAELPPASQAEVEAKYQAVVGRYGARFSEAQKIEVRRQLIETQKALDTLRAFPLKNSDPPATTFRVYRRPLGAAGKPTAKAGKS